MISVSCRSCGSDLEDPRDAVCMHCGLPVGGRRPPAEPEPAPPPVVDEQPAGETDDHGESGPPAKPPPLSAESLWKLGLLAALLVSIVAVAAIAVTLLSAVTRSPEPQTSSTTSATAVIEGDQPDAGPVRWSPDFDPPVGEAITIDHPNLDAVTREHVGGEVVTLQVDAHNCGSGEGTLTATGSITNYSMARQRFDYTITVDLIRAWNRSTIGTLSTTVEGLGPLESAEWSVEMLSSRVSSIDCDVTSVTATPSG